jgi:hypothetical protein
MPFQCSICDEPSTRICVRCTKDACDNHICEKCLKCSDCCECEVALNATPRTTPIVHTTPAPETEFEVQAAPALAPSLPEEPALEAEAAPFAEPPVSEAPAPHPIALAEPLPPAPEGEQPPTPSETPWE